MINHSLLLLLLYFTTLISPTSPSYNSDKVSLLGVQPSHAQKPQLVQLPVDLPFSSSIPTPLELRYPTIESALDSALEFLKKEQYPLVVAICRHVLGLDPYNFNALMLLGQVLAVNSRTRTEAFGYLQEAKGLNPSNPATRYWIGDVLWNWGDIPEAQEEFRYAAQSPQSTAELVYESRMALAKTYAYHTDIDSDGTNLWNALRELKAAERLHGEKAEVHFHKGLTLDRLGLVDRAIESYTKTIEYDPKMTFAHANKAVLLLRQGLNADAFMSALTALKLEPLNGDLHNNLGVILLESGKTTLAEHHWLEAVKLSPTCLNAHASLGNMYQDKSDTAAAKKHWDIATALAISSGAHSLAFSLQIRSKLGLERVYDSFQHISRIRTRYENALRELLLDKEHDSTSLVGIDALAEMITDIGYYFVYLGFPNVAVREQQAKLFRKLVPELTLKTLPSPAPSIFTQDQVEKSSQIVCSASQTVSNIDCECLLYNKSNAKQRVHKRLEKGQIRSKKRKIGFISEFFADHSVSKLIRNTIRLLSSKEKEENWEIVLFVVGQARQDETSKKLHDVVKRVVPINANFQTLLDNVLHTRKVIAKEKLDILVFPEIGIGHLSYFVAHARVAPVQISFWGHPVTTGLSDSIDYFISSKLFERNWSPERDGKKYSEALWLMEGLSTLFPKPPAPMFTNKTQARVELIGEEYVESHIYVCPQTAYKFHPLMDRALIDILNMDNQGVLVLIESARPEWIGKVRQRLGVTPEILSRIVVVPAMPLNKFLSLLIAADVVLDTFPFGGGVSHFEALAVSAAVVVYAHEIPWIPQYASGIYEFMSLNGRDYGNVNLVTETTQEYVQTAVKLANNATIQDKTRERIREAVQSSGVFFSEDQSDSSSKLVDDWALLFACAQYNKS